MYNFTSPPKVEVAFSKKKNKPVEFILNLNTYRNAFYRILNLAKTKYKEILEEQFGKLDKKKMNHLFRKIVTVYTIYKGDKRRCDVGNIASIHQKFFEDAFVESGCLFDDSYNNIPMCIFLWGGIDKENPRVEVSVYDLLERTDVKELYFLLDDKLHEFLKQNEE